MSARAGFVPALAAEWTKARTLPSVIGIWAAAVAVVPVIAVFVGLTRSLQPDDTVLGGSLTGAVFAQIAGALAGVLVMTGEYGSGTIRATLAASPRRGTVLLAKAVLVAAGTFTAGLLGGLVAARIGAVFLSDAGYAAGDPMPALIGVALSVAAVGLIGLALGTLLRSSAAGAIAVIGVLLAPALVGPLFGDWQRWVVGASPLSVLQKLAQSSDVSPEVAGSLGGWASLVLLCGAAILAVAVAGRVLRARDA